MKKYFALFVCFGFFATSAAVGVSASAAIFVTEVDGARAFEGPGAPESAKASTKPHTPHRIPHLDLDATSAELTRLLQKQSAFLKSCAAPGEPGDNCEEPPPSISKAFAVGERLFRWVDLINESREKGQKIRLTSEKTREGTPINKAKAYSPRSVAADLEKLEQEMPAPMHEILFDNKSTLPTTNPVSDEEFILFGRRADKIYQTAARWWLLFPYKLEYSLAQMRDIRGYYYLVTNNWNADTLQRWSELDSITQDEIKKALWGICRNSRVSKWQCSTLVGQILDAQGAVSLYNRFFTGSEQIYESFFAIQNARQDLVWSAEEPNFSSVPFLEPEEPAVRSFIKDNIEEEFAWLGWKLNINFVKKGSFVPYIVFIPGVTANVEYLGGNKIEMDANKSLEEYEERWTIRHEFGHVLGLPDCYHEFYDDENDEFVNYQLDITNIMCSRAGNFSQRTFDDLKAAYFGRKTPSPSALPWATPSRPAPLRK